MYKDVTNPRQQQLDEIERIENLPRPHIWRATKDFVLRLHPEFRDIDRQFVEACREIREADLTNKTASSKSGSMRNTMKIPQFIYEALIAMDPPLLEDISGKNGEAAAMMGKKLYNAFPEYRIARAY